MKEEKSGKCCYLFQICINTNTAKNTTDNLNDQSKGSEDSATQENVDLHYSRKADWNCTFWLQTRLWNGCVRSTYMGNSWNAMLTKRKTQELRDHSQIPFWKCPSLVGKFTGVSCCRRASTPFLIPHSAMWPRLSWWKRRENFQNFPQRVKDDRTENLRGTVVRA